MILVFMGVLTVKFISHEQKQNKIIDELYTMNNELKAELLSQREYFEERINQSINYFEYDIHYTKNTYNYLAIGNSLTLIKSWGRGICSTMPDNDYFNIVVKYLKNNYNGKVVAYPFNFAVWERSNNRLSNFKLIDVFLSQELDLVTIQLGENVVDLKSFESDLENLIKYIHSKAPKARIIVVGDFWDQSRNELRKAAALNTNSCFADLSEIINNPIYQSKEGTECIGPNNTKIYVSKVAATHPGDKGMEYIANQIINNIN